MKINIFLKLSPLITICKEMFNLIDCMQLWIRRKMASKLSGARTSLLNDIKLVWQVKPDAIFIPNLNIGYHVLLLLLASFHILNILIFAYLDYAPRGIG